MSDKSSPLKVLIAGAGIGGLTVAVALRRQGHDVHIFEKSAFSDEVGAALTLPPNVDGLLKRMGFDPAKNGGTRENRITRYTAQGEVIATEDFSKLRKFFSPNEAATIHRVDLHDGLRKLALSLGVVMHLQKAVTACDPQAAKIILEDNTAVTGDVVIGADGIHSKIRRTILSEDEPPHPFGMSTFRFLVPSSRIEKDPAAKNFIEKDGHLTVWGEGGGRQFITYPCRQNKLVNAVAIFPEELAMPDPKDLILKRTMLKLYSDFSHEVKALMMLADKVMIWRLFDVSTLQPWSRDKATLIGDAAHPVLPSSAQGAAQAIEDAATLAVLLHRGTKPTQVAHRLRIYHTCRRERVNFIQAFGRSVLRQSKPGRHVEPLVPYAEYNHVVFRHDAWAHAEQALAWEEDKIRWAYLKVAAAGRFFRKGMGIAVASLQGK